MTITPGLAAELQLLTQALDLPGMDVSDTLARLAVDAQTAVNSYLGLSVMITANGSPFALTVLAEGTQPDQIRTSLFVPLMAAVDTSIAPASVALILYAATPGAFIDVAADLAWITARTLADFRLDERRTLPSPPAISHHIAATSNIN